MTDVKNYLAQIQTLVEQIPSGDVEKVTDLLWENYDAARRVVFCGNGGSAATASHLPADFQKGMFTEFGRPWECLSLVDSMALVTAWSNDTSYANVFAGQVKTWLRPNDILVAISGSGNSENVIAAVHAAQECGAITIGLCGFGGGKLAAVVQHAIVLKSRNMQMVEDVHMILGHAIYSALRDRAIRQAAEAA